MRVTSAKVYAGQRLASIIGGFASRPYSRNSRNYLPFLLNLQTRRIRYYRHMRKKCFRLRPPMDVLVTKRS
jgi:hypothetical protein